RCTLCRTVGRPAARDGVRTRSASAIMNPPLQQPSARCRVKSSTAPQPHSRPDAASDIADAVAAGTGTSTHHLAGWCLHHYEEVTSTNDVAARFPAWHAVWSDRQNTGRGRHGRKWISQAGGLWLSAVVPAGSAD